ncbi:uncharacterized protein LOC143619817 isoform X1 [Bidens hawaiensis]|uniref:uncharacterized protein LOC143619817 isoform X1 n=1 Tax=Bidens hawaiensis TaxID=980011 RepID=UPI00404B7016
MLGAGLQFGRSRGGDDDRFYNPVKARSNRHRVQSDVNATESSSSSSALCNLERFLESVTPSVTAQHPSKQRAMRGWRTIDMESQPYFVLGDLWESFKEWSAYGAGFPLMLDDTDSVIQYYVPYLSAIQIYGHPLNSSSSDSFKDSSSDASSDYEHSELCMQMSQLSVNDEEGFCSDDSDSVNSQSCLLFEYMERNQPWGREPLADKILDLARCFPELKSLRSCDLLPSSWFSVAWYPIYRIPMGSTLKDLDACFLTFHSLHTTLTGDQCDHPPVVSYPNGIYGIPVVSLPAFGLASYKFKPVPLWVHNDQRLVSDLLQAADSWLAMLQVNHPDYLFFSRR